MFDIGFSEIVVIFGLALIVLGPEKLPRLAQTIGRWAGRARAMARQFRDQLEQEAEQFKTDIDPDAPLGARATAVRSTLCNARTDARNAPVTGHIAGGTAPATG
jgi:sec-independent protein translocase protein TatB